jgi:hypothetical protein
MKNFALLAMLAVAAASQASVTAAPLGTWGFNGDGWWAPGENGITYLGTANAQRLLSTRLLGMCCWAMELASAFWMVRRVSERAFST